MLSMARALSWLCPCLVRETRSTWRHTPILMALLSSLACARAAEEKREQASPTKAPERGAWLIPYGFYAESFGLAGGMAGVWPVAQSTVEYLGGMVSSNGSVVGFAGVSDWMPGERSRLSLSAYLIAGSYTDQSLYVSPGATPRASRAGTNESRPENRQQGSGYNIYGQTTGIFVLPLLDGADGIGDRHLPTQERDPRWKPVGHGFVDVDWILFHHSQEVDDGGVYTSFATTGIGVGLTYDVTDYAKNPTSGGRCRIGVSGDMLGVGSDDTWMLVEGQASIFVTIPVPDFSGRAVLALDAWTADSPSWREEPDGTVRHRPPPVEGASLGGYYRLRALPVARYNDRAAIDYAVEIRVMPAWSPELDLPLFGPLAVNWWQVVAFAEIGRVAGTWNPSVLHREMQSDFGLGLRAMIERAVARADVAFCDEAWGITVMVGHTF